MLGSLWRFAVRTAAGAVALWVVIKLIDGISLSFPTTPLYQDGQHDNLLTFLAVAAIMILCLVGVVVSLARGDVTGVTAGIIFPVVLGFASVRLLRR